MGFILVRNGYIYIKEKCTYRVNKPYIILFHFYEIFGIPASILNMGDFFSDVENVLKLNRGKTTL